MARSQSGASSIEDLEMVEQFERYDGHDDEDFEEQWEREMDFMLHDPTPSGEETSLIAERQHEEGEK